MDDSLENAKKRFLVEDFVAFENRAGGVLFFLVGCGLNKRFVCLQICFLKRFAMILSLFFLVVFRFRVASDMQLSGKMIEERSMVGNNCGEDTLR